MLRRKETLTISLNPKIPNFQVRQILELLSLRLFGVV